MPPRGRSSVNAATFRKDVEEQMEAAIDTWGLAYFLDVVADVLYDKYSHIANNWQDTVTAREWKRAADKVYRIAGSSDLPS